MKRKKSQEKRKTSGQGSQDEVPSPQVLLEELAKSPKECANNVAHIIMYIKGNVRRCPTVGLEFDLAACNLHVDLFCFSNSYNLLFLDFY